MTNSEISVGELARAMRTYSSSLVSVPEGDPTSSSTRRKSKNMRTINNAEDLSKNLKRGDEVNFYFSQSDVIKYGVRYEEAEGYYLEEWKFPIL